MRVSLAHRVLLKVPKSLLKYADEITELDLTETKLKEFQPLANLKNLHTLILDKNDLTSHALLPAMPNLKVLWMNHNSIENLAYFIDELSSKCPNLTHFSMMDNPAAPSFFNGGSVQEYQDYRHFVISRFASLLHLDFQEVTIKERREAERIYPRMFFARKDSLSLEGASMPSSANTSRLSQASSSSSFRK